MSVTFFVMSNMVKEWCAKTGLAAAKAPTATAYKNWDRSAREILIGNLFLPAFRWSRSVRFQVEHVTVR